MRVTLLALALAGAVALPAAASAGDDPCVHPQSYMDVCHDLSQPGCVYGTLGAEAAFSFGCAPTLARS